MRYRKLKADELFDGNQLWKDKVLILNPYNIVESIVPTSEAGEDIETYPGILTPGFINAHCHLELSYLKGLVSTGLGLVDFLLSVIKLRSGLQANKHEPIVNAIEEMRSKGIVAVGDICNTVDAVAAKQNSGMDWYSFIEIINYRKERLGDVIANSRDIVDQHTSSGLSAVLSAHAPYTVNADTYKIINEATGGKTITIHNQESEAEDALFKTGHSDFLRIYQKFGDGTSPFPVSGKSSFQTWLPFFNNAQTILSVHNTYTSKEDIDFGKEYASKHEVQIVYCLCPNANLYIENKLPPIELLMEYDCDIVLGTDSYSSNHQLDIAAEMKAIAKGYPHLPIELLLKWATSNGAKALGLQGYGSFQKGYQPGVVLFDPQTFTSKKLI
ncbi:MAG TPA: amidohydrolase family protein [Chitinophagaceae bacterium]